jgi:hypothetical protein
MAESYNAIAIRMGIDTSQFDAGLRRAQKQIDDVAARMAQASEENRQRASMAAGMTGMGVGVTPEDRRLSEQIATRLKINQIINQQNQLFEQNRARQQAINAETERYNRVTSTLLVNMIRRTQEEANSRRQLLAAAEERDRQLAKEVQARLTLNTIYRQQKQLLEERERVSKAADARTEIRRMLTQEEEKTNELLAFQNKQRKDLLALQKQLDAAGLKGRSRQVLIEEFQALQAATKAQWEKGNAHKYVTDLERKAAAVKERLITAEQRHAAELADLKSMLQQNMLTQEQYTAAVKQADTALAMQKGGFGRMAGAATQASFAIEDFVQVMSMGGGLNMALMSASNNMTMVIRSLNLFSGTLGTVAMFGLPLLAVGITSAIGYLNKAEKATDRWKDALDDLERRWKNSGWREMARLKLKDFERQIKGSSTEQLTERENELLAEQEKLKAKLLQQDMERTRKNQELFMGLVGGQEAYMEMQQALTKVVIHGSEAEKQQAKELLNLMGQAQQAALEGRREVALASLREMLRMMELLRESGKMTDALGVSAVQAVGAWSSIGSVVGAFSADEWDKFFAGFDDPAFVDALQGLFGAQGNEAFFGFEDNIEQLKAFRDELLGSETDLTEEQKRQLEIAEELLKIADEKQKAAEREIEAAKQLAEEHKNALHLKRQEMLFAMTASDEEKKAAELERQRQEYVGITPGEAALAMAGGDPSAYFEMQAKSTEFLLAAQEQTQRQIDEMQKVTSPDYLGALQQDAFQAQAEAFKQMDKARQEKPNPQLDRQIDLLNRINDALNKGTPLVVAGGP